jgi:hypothetical protein
MITSGGAPRDHDLEGGEATWIGQGKIGSDIPKGLSVSYPHTFGYTLFHFDPDKILLGGGVAFVVFGKCEKGSLLILLHVHRYTHEVIAYIRTSVQTLA